MPTKLKAAPGTDEANVGTTDYKFLPGGIINVPDDQVDDLVARGGFTVVEKAPAAPDGSVAMKAPDAGASCSFGGISYTPDKKGFVIVPAIAVAVLIAHGFVPGAD